MKALSDCCTTEVQQEDGTWVKVHDEQLEDGDIIRVFYPDGSRKLIGKYDVFVVMSEPSIQLVTVKYQR